MIDRVLVPMDGSEMSVRALEYALDVHNGAEITVLFVAGEAVTDDEAGTRARARD